MAREQRSVKEGSDVESEDVGDAVVERIQRWCGVCFAWKEEVEERCASCGNKYMTGRGVPIEDVVSNSDDSGYAQLVENMRADANNQEARGGDPNSIGALRTIASFIATGRWGENPIRTRP